MNLKILLKPYEATITLFYILCVVSIYMMWINDDLIWLIAMPIAGWVNHFIFSLNHRMIAHKSFKARNKFIHNLIIFLNVFQVSHSPMRFAMFHRHHHRHADVPGKDIHGPTMGFLESVVGWEYNLEETFKRLNIKIPKDLMRDHFLVWIDKHFYKILFSVSVIIYLISWQAFWYILIPGSVWFRLSASYFSNYHTSYFGYVNYDLGPDTAKNSILANIFTCGEGWHNNHHAFPSSWKYGRQPWEWDPPQWAIKNFLGAKQ
jgi:fatty-acid desaturase